MFPNCLFYGIDDKVSGKKPRRFREGNRNVVKQYPSSSGIIIAIATVLLLMLPYLVCPRTLGRTTSRSKFFYAVLNDVKFYA